MKLKYFGTDGVRGAVGREIFNEAWIRRFGYALGAYGKALSGEKPLTVVIGYDTRESSPWIHDLLLEGLNESQAYVYSLKVVPTPAVALNVIELQATLGIVVTASHNPVSDNGIKIFNAQGHKLTVEEEVKIEALLEEVPEQLSMPALQVSYPYDGLGVYVSTIRSLVHQNSFKDYKVVLDCSNGATWQSSPSVLKHFGVDLVVLNDSPDGKNINDGVGSEHPQRMAQAVLEHGADLGIAHDGDGDRVIFCGPDGELIDGDQILGILALDFFDRKVSCSEQLVSTVQSNLGLDNAFAQKGGIVSRVDVGDRNVAERMRETGAPVGGENSGHIILSEFATTGDGLIAATEVLRIMSERGKAIGELAQEITLYPQKVASLRVEAKPELSTIDELSAMTASCEQALNGRGRIMTRYSGTEPKLRFLVEADTEAQADEVLQKITSSAEAGLRRLGAL